MTGVRWLLCTGMEWNVVEVCGCVLLCAHEKWRGMGVVYRDGVECCGGVWLCAPVCTWNVTWDGCCVQGWSGMLWRCVVVCSCVHMKSDVGWVLCTGMEWNVVEVCGCVLLCAQEKWRGMGVVYRDGLLWRCVVVCSCVHRMTGVGWLLCTGVGCCGDVWLWMEVQEKSKCTENCCRQVRSKFIQSQAIQITALGPVKVRPKGGMTSCCKITKEHKQIRLDSNLKTSSGWLAGPSHPVHFQFSIHCPVSVDSLSLWWQTLLCWTLGCCCLFSCSSSPSCLFSFWTLLFPSSVSLSW